MKFQFENFQQFFEMGNHGFYIWLAYGVSLSVLMLLAVSPIVQKRQFIRQQYAAHQREQHSKRSAQTAAD